MKVKMCGLYCPEDIDYANEVQPDYVDLYFTRRATGWSQRSRQRNTVRSFHLESGQLGYS